MVAVVAIFMAIVAAAAAVGMEVLKAVASKIAAATAGHCEPTVYPRPWLTVGMGSRPEEFVIGGLPIGANVLLDLPHQNQILVLVHSTKHLN